MILNIKIQRYYMTIFHELVGIALSLTDFIASNETSIVIFVLVMLKWDIALFRHQLFLDSKVIE